MSLFQLHPPRINLEGFLKLEQKQFMQLALNKTEKRSLSLRPVIIELEVNCLMTVKDIHAVHDMNDQLQLDWFI